jgi:hypothetical protein
MTGDFALEIAESFLIDKEAVRIFNKLLPETWLPRKEDPDFGIDYFVEIGDLKEGPSGIRFGAQVKGKKAPKYTQDGFITKQIERKYIEYWVDRVRQPVFFVVVDLPKEEAYWIFIQEWGLKDESWRDKKEPTVRIPIEQRLSDIVKFRQEIIRAEEFMRERYPSSIKAALAGEKKKLEQLDDRLVLSDLEVSGGNITYHLDACKPIEFHIHVTSEHPDRVRERIAQLVNFGTPAVLTSKDVCIKGSPLLDEKEFHSLQLLSANTKESELELISVDSEGNELESIRILGSMTFGNKGSFFVSYPGRLPVYSKVIFRINSGGIDHDITATFGIDSAAWKGKPLSNLQYFDKLMAFFSSLAKSTVTKLKCSCEGYLLFSGVRSLPTDGPYVEAFNWYLKETDKARFIAKTLKIDPHLPDFTKISDEELRNLGLLYDLLREGEYRQVGDGMSLKTRIVFHEKGLSELNKCRSNSLAVVIKEVNVFNFFDTEVVTKLQFGLTKAKFRGDLDKINTGDKDAMENGLPCEWIGEEGSELIIKLEEIERVTAAPIKL